VLINLRSLILVIIIVKASNLLSDTSASAFAAFWLYHIGQFLFLAIFLLPICTNLQALSGRPTKHVRVANLIILGILAVALVLYLSLFSYSKFGLNDDALGIAEIKAAYSYIFLLAVAKGTVLGILAIKRMRCNVNNLRIWFFLSCFALVLFSVTDAVQFTLYCIPNEIMVDSVYTAVAVILTLTGPLAATSMLGVALDKVWTLDDPYQTAYNPYRTANDPGNAQQAYNLSLVQYQGSQSQETSQEMEHRDAFGRQFRVYHKNKNRDHYLRPEDGRLDLLRVQVFDPVAPSNDSSVEWVRVNMSTKSTPLNKVLYWTWSGTQAGNGAPGKSNEHPYFGVALKWVPSCIAMLFLVSFLRRRPAVFRR
jgi:hypothetical protein